MEVMETSPTVPIMTLKHPDETVDLAEVFKRHQILTTSGADFMNLGKNYVRFRMCKNDEVDQVSLKIRDIESSL